MKDTQCSKVLRHMQDFGSITQAEATSEYGCYRLAARISDLRKQGYIITSEPETTNNRYGEPVRFARYRLEEGTSNGTDTIHIL